MRAPTARQTEYLAFLRAEIRSRGFAPTLREIGEHFGVSNEGVLCNLAALEAKGRIVRVPLVARGIRLVEPDSLPVVTVEQLRRGA